MYKVAIKNNETGEVRVSTQNFEFEAHTEWAWTEGNYGCDCNRHLEFERAIGNTPDFDEAICGDDKYSVLYFEIDDGEIINIED